MSTEVNKHADPLRAWLERQDERTSDRIARADRRGPLPASHAQRGMWLSQEILGEDDRSLMMPHAYQISGELDFGALVAALTAVIARHEVLRTGFIEDSADLRQVTRTPVPMELGLESVDGCADLVARMRAYEQLPFDLRSDALMRARLYRLAAAEHVLLVVFHHIANDGWSMDVFHRELTALYDVAVVLSREAESDVLVEAAGLPDLAIQYADYAAWQWESAKSGRFDAALGYWRTSLDGAPALLDLPTDRPRPAVRTSAGDRVAFTVDADTTEAVARTASAQGTTPFAVTFTTFQLLLSLWSGQADVVTGVSAANRALPETESLIGFFVNVLPIRVAYPAECTFAEALSHASLALLESYTHQDVPFELLLEELTIPRSAAYNPLVQVTVASHQEFTASLRPTGLTVEKLPRHALDVHEDLTLYLTSGTDAINCHLTFRVDLFDRSTIERLGAAFVHLLDLVCADPQVSPQALAGRLQLPSRRRHAACVGEPGPTPESDSTPSREVEQLVVAAWESALGAGTAEDGRSFFLAGGTSLAAVRLANRLSVQLGFMVPVRAIFRHSDLPALTRHVEDLIRAAMASEAGGGLA